MQGMKINNENHTRDVPTETYNGLYTRVVELSLTLSMSGHRTLCHQPSHSPNLESVTLALARATCSLLFIVELDLGWTSKLRFNCWLSFSCTRGRDTLYTAVNNCVDKFFFFL